MKRGSISDFFSELHESLVDLEDQLESSGWREKFEENLVPCMIVFVFLCGLGSCAVFTVQGVANTKARKQAAAAEVRPKNPWALDQQDKSGEP